MGDKGQSAMEFAALVTFMMLVFISFLVVVTERFVIIQDENQRLALEGVGSFIQNELKLAAIAVDGYNRRFDIPLRISGNPYNVTINNRIPGLLNHTELVLRYSNSSNDNQLVFDIIGDVRGQIDPERNTTVVISKQDSIVWIHS